MTKAVSPRVVPPFFATTSNHKRDCCTKAICFVAFGIRARSRTRVRSLPLILSALHLILRAKSQHILVNVREWHFVQHSQTMLKCNILPNKMGIFENR